MGESAELDGTRLTVTELDGRRISKVKVTESTPPPVQPTWSETATQVS
jgi:CBS domain containing-hemolysin-like protein